MNRMLLTTILTGAAIAVLLASTGVGFRIGTGSWPSFTATRSTSSPTPSAAKAERKVLYWTHPDGAPDYAPAPARTSDGRDYLPVYEDEEKGFAETTPPAPVEPKGDRKILYYRNPMGLADTSPVPKKDWMGMDYIAVYEGEDDGGATVKVSLDKVQRAGVRSEEARLESLARPIRAPGTAKPDERTLRTVTLRADGFIEKLYVNETGKHVNAGDPLFRVYSQDILRALIDYRLGAKEGADPRTSLLTGEQKLRSLQIPQAAIDDARLAKEVSMSLDWPSPATGVVTKKKVVEGQMARMGDELFEIVDLSSIWVIADVPEQDVAGVEIGAPAKVTFRALEGETFTGKVTLILHELDSATRTAKIRIEVANPNHHIKHEMYADVEIAAGNAEDKRLVVPLSSVIDSGNRQIVLVDLGEGRFQPRHVELGLRGDGLVEIRQGLKPGEKVVTKANFLIDAESNLKSALSSFSGDSPVAPATEPAP